MNPRQALALSPDCTTSPPRQSRAVCLPSFHGLCFHIAIRKPPKLVPSTIAASVENSTRPFPAVISASLIISGKMPYFAGLKKFACVARRKQHDE